eukprot:scaffold26937_cov44-Tisochrysis_lutea.AAC.1
MLACVYTWAVPSYILHCRTGPTKYKQSWATFIYPFSGWNQLVLVLVQVGTNLFSGWNQLVQWLEPTCSVGGTNLFSGGSQLVQGGVNLFSGGNMFMFSSFIQL